ncbi:Myb-like protein I [Balamuthia mandrillaris]
MLSKQEMTGTRMTRHASIDYGYLGRAAAVASSSSLVNGSEGGLAAIRERALRSGGGVHSWRTNPSSSSSSNLATQSPTTSSASSYVTALSGSPPLHAQYQQHYPQSHLPPSPSLPPLESFSSPSTSAAEGSTMAGFPPSIVSHHHHQHNLASSSSGSNNRRNTLPLAHSDMELELQIRHNMLVEQQHRIAHLEEELSRARLEIDRLTTKVRLFEEEKQRSNNKKAQSRYWTPEEHQRFLEGVEKYGPKDVKAIAAHVGTRNPTQVRTHAQKYYLRIERERKRREERENGGKCEINSDDENDVKEEEDDDEEEGEGSSGNRTELTDGQEGSTEMTSDMTASDNAADPKKSEKSKRPRTKSSKKQNIGDSALKREALERLKDWTDTEYDLFERGLSLYSANSPLTDANLQAALENIRTRSLPHRSLDDLYRIYHILEECKNSFDPKNIAASKRAKKKKTSLSSIDSNFSSVLSSSPSLRATMPQRRHSVQYPPAPSIGGGSGMMMERGFDDASLHSAHYSQPYYRPYSPPPAVVAATAGGDFFPAEHTRAADDWFNESHLPPANSNNPYYGRRSSLPASFLSSASSHHGGPRGMHQTSWNHHPSSAASAKSHSNYSRPAIDYASSYLSSRGGGAPGYPYPIRGPSSSSQTPNEFFQRNTSSQYSVSPPTSASQDDSFLGSIPHRPPDVSLSPLQCSPSSSSGVVGVLTDGEGGQPAAYSFSSFERAMAAPQPYRRHSIAHPLRSEQQQRLEQIHQRHLEATEQQQTPIKEEDRFRAVPSQRYSIDEKPPPSHLLQQQPQSNDAQQQRTERRNSIGGGGNGGSLSLDNNATLSASSSQ